jgi:hypothetical protein
LTATSLSQFLAGATTILNNVHATQPSDRAEAIAREIGNLQPTLVSLEEVTKWRTCPTINFQTCAAPQTVEFDLLQLILDALYRQSNWQRA